MKRTHGFTLLLLVFLLVAMPAVATDLVSVNVQEFRLDETETKLMGWEELAATERGENMAALSAESYLRMDEFDYIVTASTEAINDIIDTISGFAKAQEVITPRGG